MPTRAGSPPTSCATSPVPTGTWRRWTPCSSARGAPAPHRLRERLDADDHPRVRYARSLRGDVRVYGDERGLVTLADGTAGRRELSIELDDVDAGGAGRGRSLLKDALTLVPTGEAVFAAVSPGNARSLRAFLAAGFEPLGSEVVLRPVRSGGGGPMTDR